MQNCGNGNGNDSSMDVVQNENYLIRVIQMLCRETRDVCRMEWEEKDREMLEHDNKTVLSDHPSISLSSSLPTTEKANTNAAPSSNPHQLAGMEQMIKATKSHLPKEHLLAPPPTPAIRHPQLHDSSTWRLKIHCCPLGTLLQRMSMLLEKLFNMAQMSLQQHKKDNFTKTTVTMTVPLLLDEEDERNEADAAGTTSKGGAEDENVMSDNNTMSNENYDINNNSWLSDRFATAPILELVSLLI